jgi:Fur family transcriptional regulator, ferric uptake regulator
LKTNLLKLWIPEEGLKTTKQREEILKVFLNSTGHKNLSQIHAQVSKVDPKIGVITVYRTLKLLARFGLAAQRKFSDGETRYEPTARGNHHDHLICLGCGKIIEFENEALEALQGSIAERYHFKVFHHRMELYGQCADCAKKRSSGRKR